jgi:hypothetical protein
MLAAMRKADLDSIRGKFTFNVKRTLGRALLVARFGDEAYLRACSSNAMTSSVGRTSPKT